jgi:hypothetical protein
VPLVLVKQASVASPDRIHALSLVERAFYRACVTIRHQSWLSPVVPRVTAI